MFSKERLLATVEADVSGEGSCLYPVSFWIVFADQVD